LRALLKRTLLVALLSHGLAACGGLVPAASPGAKAVQAPTAREPIAAPAAKSQIATPVTANPVATVMGENALKLGVSQGPAFSSFKVSDAAARRGLLSFRASCAALVKRKDLSGLAQGSDWAPACAAAKITSDADARAFFEQNFEVVQVGDGKSFATGYYEPEIEGARTRSDKYNTPVYGRPPELVDVDLGEFSDTLKGKKIRGKIVGNRFVPYADRAEIEGGALAGRGLEIAWVADPVAFFFLQVQGSGRLRLPEGGVMRIAYDGQNGRDYTGIGKLMKERGLLAPGKATMQGIVEWLKANPQEGEKIMRENRSWVFFRELTGPGPVGALNVPVTAQGSVAADPMFVPLGAPVILSMDRAEPSGLWVAQDTGGAIKGSNRFDTFWGSGDDAAVLAGGMAAHGSAFLLLPLGSLARLITP
jgi:membrane-bound lytic murein transglycosylase A